ncbi:MAG: hypothetical protein ABFD60_06285 [Bryobacteraceae bacterium]
METFWGLFEKRIVDMQSNERAILLLLITACFCLVAYAVSLLLQVAKRWEQQDAESPTVPISIRKKLFGAEVADPHHHARVSHTD